MREFQQRIGLEGAVDGGRSAILTRSVEEAIDPMFESEPGCLMHKQGSFQPVWLPDGASFEDERLDVFLLPGVSEGPVPVMVSGEVVTSAVDSPAARRFLMYLLEDAAFEAWHEVGGSLVARASLEEEIGDDLLDRRLAGLIDEAETILYDASDLMPLEVGSEAFFRGMGDLVAGISPEQVARDLQETAADASEG